MVSQEFKDKNFYSWLYFYLGVNIIYYTIYYFQDFLSPIIIDTSLIESSEGYLHISQLLFLSLFIIPIGFAFVYLILYMSEAFFRGYILRISTAHFKSFFLGNITQSILSVALGLLIDILSSIHISNLIGEKKPVLIFPLVFTFINALILGNFKKEFGTIKSIVKLHIYSFLIFLFPLSISFILSIVNGKVFSADLFYLYIYSNRTCMLIIPILTFILGIALIYMGDKKIKLLRELNPKNWKIKDDVVQDTEDNAIENIEDENNSLS